MKGCRCLLLSTGASVLLAAIGRLACFLKFELLLLMALSENGRFASLSLFLFLRTQDQSQCARRRLPSRQDGKPVDNASISISIGIGNGRTNGQAGKNVEQADHHQDSSDH